MSATAVQKRGFKGTVKRTGKKAKDFSVKKIEKLKSYGKGYKSDIKRAYDLGYSRGWEDSYNVSKRVGAKTAAAVGYKKGLKCRRKSDKYTAQFERKGRS